MAVERSETVSHLIDVLDRVLEKGVVVDVGQARESRGGIDLLAADARLIALPDLGVEVDRSGCPTRTATRPPRRR